MSGTLAPAAVRNHPSNTLVREYWKITDEGQRPRVVGVLASQLPTKPRPFDRLRQNLRKLCHSLQVCQGSWLLGLEQLAGWVEPKPWL